MSKSLIKRRGPGILTRFAQLLLVSQIKQTVVLEGLTVEGFATATKIKAKQDTGLMRIPI